MEPSSRCRCDECKSIEAILQELDWTTPIIAKREMMGAMAD